MEPITTLVAMLAAAAPMLMAGAIVFFIAAMITKFFLQLVQPRERSLRVA